MRDPNRVPPLTTTAPPLTTASVMDTELKKRLGSKMIWQRLLYMLLFVAIFALVGVVLAFLVVVQVILTLLAGGANARLQRLGREFGGYLHRIVSFLAYATEDMPYPFSSWSPTAKNTPERKAPQS